MGKLTRRTFLAAGGGALVLGLGALSPAASAAQSEAAAPASGTGGDFSDATSGHATATQLDAGCAGGPCYDGYQDVYREAWRWDRVVRTTHLRANCFSACAWNAYVKDGIVWREEQAQVYSREGHPLADFAPRGCQKGACYSSLMLAPDRISYPLRRVGPRGSGRWKRVSWEDALEELADAVIRANVEEGPECVIYDNGTSNVDSGPGSTGEMRLFTMLGATMLDGFGGTGDLAMGAVQTWGNSHVDGSSDDWMRADTLIVWHSNPVTTRIPDAHFLNEARYNGTTVVTIAPDYSASSIHSSLWVNPRVGSDAALALGVARHIIEHGAVDEDYVCEQTDLPFLVREDTRRFLRESDMKSGGSDDIFYVYDQAAAKIVKAPGSAGRWRDSLDLDGIRPALGGTFEASTRTGPVKVRPVMEYLRERLQAYSPEYVHRVSGVSESTQAALASRIAASQRSIIYATWGSNKSYHADLLHRSMILISALRGFQGRRGAGVRFAAWLPFDGGADLVPGNAPTFMQRMAMKVFTPTPRMTEDAIARASEHMPWTPSHLFLYVHGGLAEAQDADQRGEQSGRAPAAYMREALERGWLKPRPAAGKRPRVLLTSGVNPLRRWPLPQVVEKTLWPKLDMIASVDFRLSSSGMKSDLLLPAAGYYEKIGIKYALSLVPYVVVGDRAVQPLGESRSEWRIMSMLAAAIQRRAREQGIDGALSDIYDSFSGGGRYGPGDEEVVVDKILRGSPICGGVGWEEARRAGAVPFKSSGAWSATSGIGSELEEGGTLSPSRIHVEGKHAWPTLTGRQQFYLDHPWFFEMDEVLPRWKELPSPGGELPIRLSGGHTRWSIHAIWRTHPDLLRLQRGEPLMWMSVAAADARGISDADKVEVANEHGSFTVMAKVSAALPDGEAIIYHAWEPYQFENWKGNMEVVSSPYKPLHLAGGYGQLRYRVFFSGPLHVPRGVPVEIRRKL